MSCLRGLPAGKHSNLRAAQVLTELNRQRKAPESSISQSPTLCQVPRRRNPILLVSTAVPARSMITAFTRQKAFCVSWNPELRFAALGTHLRGI
jgi:hypothetical protein